MAMNGIDISNWQSGIDLSKVAADFVIIKATEGTAYVSPSCSSQYKQAKNAGKCLGLYHYANGGDMVSEAEFFLNIVGDYIGEAVLALDWESENNNAFGVNDLSWCKGWCDYIYAKTGVKPLVYFSASLLNRLQSLDYGFWIAQYANMDTTGYQSVPWNEGAYDCVIRQYSGTGRLAGYSGNLDLNKAYISKDEWLKLAGTKTEEKSFKFVEATVLGKKCKFTGFFENNENWIKARNALEAAGYTVGWNAEKKRVTAKKDGKETLLDIRTYISASGIAFCPIREMYEYLGFKVDWDGDTKSITVQ